LHQVGDLFELNVKLRCQKVKNPLFYGTRGLITLLTRTRSWPLS